MEVCSPKDGFVFQVHVQDGLQVEVGTLLIEMDSDVEDRFAEQIRVREELRKINETRYSDEQVALLRSIAKAAVDTAEAQYKDANTQHDVTIEYANVGAIGNVDLVKASAEAKLAQARFDRDRARADQKELEYAIDRFTKRNELSKNLNQYYLTYIKKRIARLKITAPVAGHVKFYVQQGSFAQLGGKLLEIH